MVIYNVLKAKKR